MGDERNPEMGSVVDTMIRIFETKFHLFGIVHNKGQHALTKRMEQVRREMTHRDTIPFLTEDVRTQVVQITEEWKRQMERLVQAHLEQLTRQLYRNLAELNLHSWESALHKAVREANRRLPSYQTHLLWSVTKELRKYCGAIFPNPIPLPESANRSAPMAEVRERDRNPRRSGGRISSTGTVVWKGPGRSGEASTPRDGGVRLNPYSREGRYEGERSFRSRTFWNKNIIHHREVSTSPRDRDGGSPSSQTPRKEARPGFRLPGTVNRKAVTENSGAPREPGTRVPKVNLPPIPRGLPALPASVGGRPQTPSGNPHPAKVRDSSGEGEGTTSETVEETSMEVTPPERVVPFEQGIPKLGNLLTGELREGAGHSTVVTGVRILPPVPKGLPTVITGRVDTGIDPGEETQGDILGSGSECSFDPHILEDTPPGEARKRGKISEKPKEAETQGVPRSMVLGPGGRVSQETGGEPWEGHGRTPEKGTDGGAWEDPVTFIRTKSPLITEHKRTQEKFGEWTLKPQRSHLILGDSNVRNLKGFTSGDIQIDIYPGLKIQHLTRLLKCGTKTSPEVREVIIVVGLNNRTQHQTEILEGAVQRLHATATATFPSANVHLAQNQFSFKLPFQEKKTLELINKHMGETPLCIPLIPRRNFKVQSDLIHWTKETGEAMCAFLINKFPFLV